MDFSSKTNSEYAQHCGRWPSTARLAVAAAMLIHIVATPPTTAQANQVSRCSKAILSSHNRILAVDARLLSRCTRNIVEQRSDQVTEDTCRRLRTADMGSDRVDRSARTRIERHCVLVQPNWLPERCMGPGPQSERALSDAQAIADCITSTGHCLALSAAESLLGEHRQALAEQHPGNLVYEFAGIAGNAFSSCFDATTATTTTTSTSTTIAVATTTTTSTTITAPIGPLVITEVMSNPAAQADSSGEYFELWNGAGTAVELQGITVRDLGSNSFTIETSLIVAAGGYVVLGRSSSAAAGAVDYVYATSMVLANSGDAIIVERDGVILDQLVYDGSFPLLAGRSIELATSAYSSSDNDLAAAWCASDTVLSDGDFGTPGSSPTGCLLQ